MATWIWIVIAIAVAAICVLGVVWAIALTRRTRMLQERFGREYDRTLDREGGRRRGEQELRARERSGIGGG